MNKIYLRDDELEVLKQKNNIKSDVQLAQKMGMDRTQIWRAKKGHPVGQKFIAQLLKVFPKAKYDRLFLNTELMQGFHTADDQYTTRQAG